MKGAGGDSLTQVDVSANLKSTKWDKKCTMAAGMLPGAVPRFFPIIKWAAAHRATKWLLLGERGEDKKPWFLRRKMVGWIDSFGKGGCPKEGGTGKGPSAARQRWRPCANFKLRWLQNR